MKKNIDKIISLILVILMITFMFYSSTFAYLADENGDRESVPAGR